MLSARVNGVDELERERENEVKDLNERERERERGRASEDTPEKKILLKTTESVLNNQRRI